MEKKPLTHESLDGFFLSNYTMLGSLLPRQNEDSSVKRER